MPNVLDSLIGEQSPLRTLTQAMDRGVVNMKPHAKLIGVDLASGPDKTGLYVSDLQAFEKKLHEAICTYVNEQGYGDVMNDNAVETLKSDLCFIVSEHLKGQMK